jgi:hypothetical protein
VGDFSGRILAERRKVGTTTHQTHSAAAAAAAAGCVFFCWLYKYSQKAILKNENYKIKC